MLKKRLIIYLFVTLITSINTIYAHILNSINTEGVLIDSQVMLTTRRSQKSSTVKVGNTSRLITESQEFLIGNNKFNLLFLEELSADSKNMPIQIKPLLLSDPSEIRTAEIYSNDFKENYIECKYIQNNNQENHLVKIIKPNDSKVIITPEIKATIDNALLTHALKPKSIWTTTSSCKEPKENIEALTLIYIERNVPYLNTNNPRHLFDFYRPYNDIGELPVLLFIHGGGWSIGSKEQFTEEAKRWSTQLGYACVTINYRLVPEGIYPIPIADTQRSIQYLRSKSKELNINPDKIIAFGYSAGAYNALAAGIKDSYCGDDRNSDLDEYWPKANAIINIAGPTDFNDESILQNELHMPLSQNVTNFVKDKTFNQIVPENYIDSLKGLASQWSLKFAANLLLPTISGMQFDTALKMANIFGYSNQKIGYEASLSLVRKLMRGTDKSGWDIANLLSEITSESVPIYSIHGENDVLVSISHANNLHQKLNVQVIKNHAFYKLKNCDHFSFLCFDKITGQLGLEDLPEFTLNTVDTKSYNLMDKIDEFLIKHDLSPGSK